MKISLEKIQTKSKIILMTSSFGGVNWGSLVTHSFEAMNHNSECSHRNHIKVERNIESILCLSLSNKFDNS